MLWVEELTLYFIANQKANAESFIADSCLVCLSTVCEIFCDMSFISKKSKSAVGLAKAK